MVRMRSKVKSSTHSRCLQLSSVAFGGYGALGQRRLNDRCNNFFEIDEHNK